MEKNNFPEIEDYYRKKYCLQILYKRHRLTFVYLQIGKIKFLLLMTEECT